MFTTIQKDEDVRSVGLPGRDRYNHFVSRAVEETKAGGAVDVAQVFATLALAEAQTLCEPSERLEVSGALTVDS